MLLALQIILATCFIGTAAGTLLKIKKDKMEDVKNATGKQWFAGFFVGILCNFLDTLGCGSFAPSTALYKTFNNQDDIDIPGSLNVGDTFPVIFEAFIFTATVDVKPMFLWAMLIAAAVGSYSFAEVVTKWPRNKIRWALGIIMPLLAIIMLMKNWQLGPFAGIEPNPENADGFTAGQLQFWVAVILNVLWGALMDIGFGLYAPCMATCIMLGVDAGTCFPIFMGSCALLMPACSIAFIKSGRFDAVATLGNMFGGLIGVFIAWKIITNLSLFWLINLVCVVLFYTAYTLISAAIKDKNADSVAA